MGTEWGQELLQKSERQREESPVAQGQRGGQGRTELGFYPLDFSVWAERDGNVSPSQLPGGRDQFSFGVLEPNLLNERKMLAFLQASTQVGEE